MLGTAITAYTHPRRGLSFYNIPYNVGQISLQDRNSGIHSSGDGYTRSYDEIVSDISDKTKCIRWRFTVSRFFGGDVFPGCSSAGHLRTTRHHFKLWQIRFLSRWCIFRRIWNHHEHCSTLHKVYSANPGFPGSKEHHWYALLFWSRKSSIILCFQHGTNILPFFDLLRADLYTFRMDWGPTKFIQWI